MMVCTEPLPNGRHADDRCALVILQRAGHDFGRRSRADVDQHGERLAVGNIAWLGVVTLRVFRLAPARRNDLARIQKIIGNGNRLVENAAAIVSQIDDEAFETRANLTLETPDRRLNSVRSFPR